MNKWFKNPNMGFPVTSTFNEPFQIQNIVLFNFILHRNNAFEGRKHIRKPSHVKDNCIIIAQILYDILYSVLGVQSLCNL